MKKIFIKLSPLVATVATLATSVSVFANSASNKINEGVNKAGGSATSTNALPDFLGQIVDALLFLIGAIAVIMIVIGGIRYVTSNGDSSQTKAAKDTILYAVIGLIVAILAYAIVKWVVNTIK